MVVVPSFRTANRPQHLHCYLSRAEPNRGQRRSLAAKEGNHGCRDRTCSPGPPRECLCWTEFEHGIQGGCSLPDQDGTQEESIEATLYTRRGPEDPARALAVRSLRPSRPPERPERIIASQDSRIGVSRAEGCSLVPWLSRKGSARWTTGAEVVFPVGLAGGAAPGAVSGHRGGDPVAVELQEVVGRRG